MTKIELAVPDEISAVTETIQSAGYEAYIVGGCVRDLLIDRSPNDWDVTSNATPEQIQDLFEHTFYENDFGTVGVVNDQIQKKIGELENELQENGSQETNTGTALVDVSDETRVTQNKINELKKILMIEVTPYRTETNYSDNRRPDSVQFSQNLSDDLVRRDFTVNALCYNPQTKELIDQHDGVSGLHKKQLVAVGDAQKRFQEDALRMMRAVRLATQLDFDVSDETSDAIIQNKELLKNISHERIRDELIKIIGSREPMRGIEMLQQHQLLEYILPEIIPAIGCDQNGSHVYDVYEHLLRTLQHAADKEWSLEIRIAALLHDISKPETRRFDKKKNDYTFYGHEVVGSRVTKKILTRLKFPNQTIENVTTLVRWHMFFSDPDEITLSAVRRIIRNVGGEKSVWNVIKLRICDRIGMGRPKERSYRLRQYESMMVEAMRSPVSVRDLKINGDEMIEMFQMKPGKKIGWILNALMNETLHEPDLNNKEWLVKRVTEMITLSDQELVELYEKGKESIDVAEKSEIKQIKRKFKVK